MAIAVRSRPKVRAKRRAPKAEPFSLAHFQAWASQVVLDTGKTWTLEAFQSRFVEDVFTGRRECWLVVPEGNGKTTLVAGLALYHCQFRLSAWVAVAASSRDQAEILYRQAEGMVLRTPFLRAAFECLPGYRRLRCGDPPSHFQVLAADERTGDGVIPTLCIVDELHRHRDLKLYRTWSGKLDKRQAQIIAISTAGEPGGEFEDNREKIRQSATSSERTETFLRAVSPDLVLHEWAVPEQGDVEDLELVKRANPFSGITVPQLLRKKDSPTMTMGHWRRFVCNLPTRSDRAAITEAEWHEATAKEPIPEGEAVWLGLKLAFKVDTTAAVPLWFKDSEHRVFGPARVIAPPRSGSSLDLAQVKRALVEIHERNPLHTVVMNLERDRGIGEWISTELGARIVDRPMTSLPLAVLDYDRFMEALRNGWLKHAGDRDLTRHVLNAVAQMQPDGRVRFNRSTQVRDIGDQEQRMIDALLAAAMVHSTAEAELSEPAPFFAGGWR